MKPQQNTAKKPKRTTKAQRNTSRWVRQQSAEAEAKIVEYLEEDIDYRNIQGRRVG